MNIAVYLGANEGNDPALATAVQELGRWIGESGNRLIYGGSKTGLMGLLADSALGAGAEVIGVELEMFMDEDYQHTGLTELIVKPDFPQRKTEIIRRSEAFIAFPGDSGSVVEVTEADFHILLTPCILYNPNGYYDYLIRLLRHMVEMGVSTKERQAGVHFVETLEEIQQILSDALA